MIEILLLRCGPYQVGIEAARVVRVERPGAEAPRPLAALLGLPDAAQPERGRVLIVAGDDGTIPILTEHRMQLAAVHPEALRSVPPTLRELGAPDWLLGTTELDGELVLLIDPVA